MRNEGESAAQRDAAAAKVGLERLERFMAVRRTDAEQYACSIVHDRILSEDIVQDAALRATNAIRRNLYDVTRPFDAWFLTIVKRMALNALALGATRYERSGLDERVIERSCGAMSTVCAEGNVAASLESLCSAAQREAEGRRLRRAFGRLPRSYQALLLGIYIEERPIAALAQERRCSDVSLRNQLMRARYYLRSLLQYA